MDNITILRCHDSLTLTKTHTRTPEGIETASYSKAATFGWRQVAVSSVDDLHAVLNGLRFDPRSCIIRGEPTATATDLVRRRVHERDGEAADFEAARPGRQWAAFDFDDVAIPHAEQMTPAEIAHEVRRTMPACWRQAACVYRLSASAGVHGWDKVSLHLWFWLDRPVYDKSLKAYAKREGFNDSCLFSAVQVHYTADPIFVGMSDPVPNRMGMLTGDLAVKVPASILDFDGWMEQQQPKPMPMPVIAYQDDRQKTLQEQYALKALASAAEEIRAQGKGNRNPEAHRQAYSIGGYVGAGVLDASHAQAVLTAAIQSVVEPSRFLKEADTVARGLHDGAANPRDVSHIGQGKPRRVERAGDDGEVPDYILAEVEEATTALETAKTDKDRKAASKALSIAKRKERMAKGDAPQFSHVREDGTVPTTQENVKALLDFYGVSFRYNVMTKDTEIEMPKDVKGHGMRRTTALMYIRSWARKHAMTVGDAFKDELGKLEDAQAYHPVKDWIMSKPWDGQDRFEQLWDSLVFREDTLEGVPLYRAMLKAWLVAGVRCAMLPLFATIGLNSHGVLCLQGPQGAGKSMWIAGLVPPGSGWHKDGLMIDPANKDSVAVATRFWLSELGEIDGTMRKSDIAALKAFLTSPSDVYRRPYAEMADEYARRTFFAATVNPEAFLKDDTGNRRFWVMPVEHCKWRPGEEGRIGDIDTQQLWAQIAAWAEKGEPHYLTPNWEALQRGDSERHRAANPMEDEILARLSVEPDAPKSQWLGTTAIYRALYPYKDLEKWTAAEKNQVAASLRGMGARSDRTKNGRLWSVIVKG